MIPGLERVGASARSSAGRAELWYNAPMILGMGNIERLPLLGLVTGVLRE